MGYDIFGADMACVDMNVCIGAYPEHNTGTRVTDFAWQGGGPVATGLVAAARLGAKCTMSGAVGNDAYGRFLKKDFEDHGVNADNFILRDGQATGLDIVVSEKEFATRTFLFYHAPNSAEGVKVDEVDWELLHQSRFLHISSIRGEHTKHALKLAKEWGIKVLIDAGGYSQEIENHISEINYFVGSEMCFDKMFPGAKEKGLTNLEPELREVMKRGPERVVFTFGGDGCIGCDDEEGFFYLPAFKVDVVDTVGAGDVFHGAYLAAVAEGKGNKECCRMASATSAIKCTRPGGRAGIPNRETLQKFLDTGVIDYTEIDQRIEYYRRAIDYVV